MGLGFDYGRRARWIGLGVAASLSLGVLLAQAQAPAKPPSADPQDISGVWFGEGNLDPDNSRYRPIEGGEPPFTPAGLALLKERQARAAAGDPIRQPADECLPHGLPGVYRLPTPHQIIQTPGQVTIITEASRTVRVIRMDEPAPKDPPLTFMGTSVGRWEGDTLVVETNGLRANWLDISGAPVSDGHSMVERWRKIDGGRKIEVVATVTDPRMYTRPWTMRREYMWSPEDKVMEYVCEESDRIEPGTERADYREKDQ